jgi:hypothetical protein
MSAGNTFIAKSLAGALLNTLLFASNVAASDDIELLAFARGDRSMLASSRPNDEMRPASSDTFEPMMATGEDLGFADITAPFGSIHLKKNPTAPPSPASKQKKIANSVSPHHKTEGGQLQRLAETVRSSHIFPSNSKFKIVRNDSVLSLSTYRHPSGRDLDLKIDTLLLAKEVIKNESPSIARINVYFFNPNDQSNYTLAEISVALVRQFDAGRVSDDAIFNAVQLRQESLGLKLNNLAKQSYQQIATTLHPGDGILLPERIELFRLAETMKRNGTEVEPMMAACLLLEDAVRQNDDQGARAAYAYALEVFESAKLKAGISSAR